jgi:hypothetical protein
VLTLLGWAIAEGWLYMIQISGWDIGWLLTKDLQSIKEFYPNYYWTIYVLARFIRFGVPLIFLAGCLGIPSWRSFIKQHTCSVWDKQWSLVSGTVVPLVTSLTLALTLYFLFRPYSIEPFQFQLLLSRAFLGVNVLNALLVALFSRRQLWKTLEDFLFEPQMPHALAITRILIFLFISSLYWMRFDGSNLGQLPRVHLPGMGWLIDILPISPDIYQWFCMVGGLFAFMVAIGFKTRLFLVLNAITIFYVAAVPHFFGKLAHEQMIIWVSWILAFSPCYDVFSVDAARKPAIEAVAKPLYGFHLKVIWLHFGIVYFFAGYFKLWICGFDWSLTNSMINQVQIEWFEHFDKLSVLRVDKFPVLLKFLGTAVIFFELAFVFMLFNRKWKWASVVGALTMHNMLGVIMYISFRRMLQTFYLVFIPWNEILQRLGKIPIWREQRTQPISWLRPVLLGPLFILSMNIIYGVFNLSSYPFSVYPVYAEIVLDNVRYFEYRIRNHGYEDINVWNEGKKHGFKWESYSRGEYHIIRTWKGSGQLDTSGVQTLWKRWRLDVPILEDIDSVDVYVVERPLAPEKAEERLSEEYLMSIYK